MLSDLEQKNTFLVFDNIFMTDIEEYYLQEHQHPRERPQEHSTPNTETSVEILEPDINTGEDASHEHTDIATNSETPTEIPANYTGREDWLEKTKNLKFPCWYCNMIPHSTPYFVPKNAEPSKNKFIMSVEGWFNTINCALSYVNDRYHNIQERNKRYELLQLLYMDLNNRNRLCDIVEAPDKFRMKKYGVGDLSEKQFLEECRRRQLSVEKLF